MKSFLPPLRLVRFHVQSYVMLEESIEEPRGGLKDIHQVSVIQSAFPSPH